MKRTQSDELGRSAMHLAAVDDRQVQKAARVSRADRKPDVWIPPYLVKEVSSAEKFLLARNCSEGFSATKPNLLI